MSEELEIQKLYQETVDKILTTPPPDPASFMQGFIVLATLRRVLALKGLRAEVGINITNNPNGVETI